MNEIPPFSPFGDRPNPFSSDFRTTLNLVGEAAANYQQNREEIERILNWYERISNRSSSVRPLCRILNGAVLIPGKQNRWKYLFEEVVWNPATNNFDTKEDGISGNDAINTIESSNNNSGVESEGVDVTDGATYNITLRPVGHGGSQPVVEFFKDPTAPDSEQWMFQCVNPVHVQCL